MYIAPLYGEVLALSAEKAQYTDVLAQSVELKTLRDNVQATYNSIPPQNIDQLNKILPDVIDNVGIVTNINAVAAQYGMTVRSVKITAPQSTDRTDVTTVSTQPYKMTNINFAVKGTYQQFISFLRDLEVNVHLTDVDALSIKSPAASATGSSSGIFEYTVDVRAYSLN